LKLVAQGEDLDLLGGDGSGLNPIAFSVPEGVELRGFVPELNWHLAVCVLATWPSCAAG
jgi:hypothetical protein